MKLETPRLWIAPISDGEMEGLIEKERDESLKLAYAEMLENCRREPEQRLWHAVWQMELKERPGTVVGDFSFKGLGADGAVEIGYGLREGCCGRGYMTEALRTLCDALFEEGYPSVYIEAVDENIGSNRVIQKAGFSFVGSRVHTPSAGESAPVSLNCYRLKRV